MRHAGASLPILAVVTALLCLSGVSVAQGAHEAGRRGEGIPQELTLKQRAERRWPQPVRVGDLQGRMVIEPSNHQAALGRISGVARGAEGDVKLVLSFGGILGIGARTIAVPIEATALLGQFVQVTDLSQAELKALPEWTGAGATPLPPDETIRIGLNRN